MRVVLAVVAATGTLGVSVAVAAPPVGFVAAPSAFSKAESWIAGKPVSSYCAPNEVALVATADPSFVVPGTVVYGVTVPGSATSYFAPSLCNIMKLWLNGRLVTRKPINLLTAASDVLTVTHEAELAKGISDETDADCAALKVLPQVVNRFFPLRKRESMHNFMADAWEVHGLSPAIYQQHPC